MFAVSMPEIFFVVTMLVLWMVPIAVAAWVVVTLHRIRTAQEAIAATLRAIDSRLSSSR